MTFRMTDAEAAAWNALRGGTATAEQKATARLVWRAVGDRWSKATNELMAQMAAAADHNSRDHSALAEVWRPLVGSLSAELPRDFEHALPLLIQGRDELIKKCGLECSSGIADAIAASMFSAWLGGYVVAAQGHIAGKRASAGHGAKKNSAKAEANRQRIIEAWAATDKKQTRGKRIAAVKQATGIKSDETIRKALRPR